MTRIKVAHPSAGGVGDWPNGTVVTLEDRHARKLLMTGYAVLVTDAPEDIPMRQTSAKRHRKERTH